MCFVTDVAFGRDAAHRTKAVTPSLENGPMAEVAWKKEERGGVQPSNPAQPMLIPNQTTKYPNNHSKSQELNNASVSIGRKEDVQKGGEQETRGGNPIHAQPTLNKWNL